MRILLLTLLILASCETSIEEQYETEKEYYTLSNRISVTMLEESTRDSSYLRGDWVDATPSTDVYGSGNVWRSEWLYGGSTEWVELINTDCSLLVKDNYTTGSPLPIKGTLYDMPLSPAKLAVYDTVEIDSRNSTIVIEVGYYYE